MLTSIIMWLEFDLDPIIDSIENILSHNYLNEYINYLMDSIIKTYINVYNDKKIMFDEILCKKEKYKEIIFK